MARSGQLRPFRELGTGRGSPAQFWKTFIIVLLLFVSMSTVQSLTNLYLDPAYARDDYRSIAQRIEREARPGDAICSTRRTSGRRSLIITAMTQMSFARACPPVTEQMASDELGQITSRYKRLFVLYWAEAEPDPNRYVERWLDANTYKGSETWYGTVRLVVYAVPVALANQPERALDVHFGDSID